MVETQQVDGGSTGGREADKFGALEFEVFVPLVAAGMEERHKLPGDGVNRRKIATFAAIAKGAGEREVVHIGLTAVLDCDDVIDFMLSEGGALRHLAVLAIVASARSYLAAQGGDGLRHCQGFGFWTAQRL
jgi:hypothetical protein